MAAAILSNSIFFAAARACVSDGFKLLATIGGGSMERRRSRRAVTCRSISSSSKLDSSFNKSTVKDNKRLLFIF